MSEGKPGSIGALAILFSVDRLVSTVVHVALAAGVLAMYVGFRVKVLGEDVAIGGDEPKHYARNR